MVNYALVEQKIQKGYAKVGKYIGAVYTVYRAQGPNDPIAPANVVTQTNAAIDVSAKMTWPRPAVFGQSEPDAYGAFDLTGINPGDYFVGPQGTFFLHDIEAFVAYHMTWCNTTVSLLRSEAPDFADSPYMADAVSQDTPLAQNWPANIILTGRHERTSLDLPGDAKTGYFMARLPVSFPVQVRQNDRIQEPDGGVFLVAAAELTPLGWRLMMVRAAK